MSWPDLWHRSAITEAAIGGRGWGDVREHARLPHSFLPENFGIYGFRNAVSGMFHKVFLQKSQSHSSIRDYFAN